MRLESDSVQAPCSPEPGSCKPCFSSVSSVAQFQLPLVVQFDHFKMRLETQQLRLNSGVLWGSGLLEPPGLDFLSPGVGIRLPGGCKGGRFHRLSLVFLTEYTDLFSVTEHLNKQNTKNAKSQSCGVLPIE